MYKYKYAIMVGRNDAAVLVDADDNKTVKAYIAKGYGIVNLVKAKYSIKVDTIDYKRKKVRNNGKSGYEGTNT